MDIKQACTLLNRIGKPVSLQDSGIKEDVPPYENYHRLEKRTDKWIYGLFVCERENNPYLKTIKEFNEEVEGVKYFFLDRLSSFYFLNKIQAFMRDHEELDIGGPKFDDNKLLKAMSLFGIPSSFFVLRQSEIKSKAIMMTKVDEDHSIISFVNSNGNVIHSTISIKNQRALFIAFKKIFMLYIFENEVIKLLESEGIANEFSERDVNTFLS
ncbi:hypothetical protein [Bacillus sp. JJ675]|uniref:hypothetical protein n=1 Tax=Bacillus sp. JJ675 TaxID=3122972 RepID=UPI0030004182